MQSLHNIEKSAFRKGEYVGYADGPWRIKRDGPVWTATKRQGVGYVAGSTLVEVSRKLAQEARTSALPNPFTS